MLFSVLSEPAPSQCSWHHCTPYHPEPRWSVNPPNVSHPHPFLMPFPSPPLPSPHLPVPINAVVVLGHVPRKTGSAMNRILLVAPRNVRFLPLFVSLMNLQLFDKVKTGAGRSMGK